MNTLIDYYVYKDTRPQQGLSSPLHKGLIPVKREGQINIAEEGCGFGLPILRYKRDFYFPGSGWSSVSGLIVNESAWKCYKFDLIERSKKKQQNKVSSFSWVFPRLYHRMYEFPFLRKFLTLGLERRQQVLKKNYESQTTFHHVKSRGEACTTYTIDRERNKITIVVEFKDLVLDGLQHIYIMNELGGGFFDSYYDSLGNHREGNEIGEWNIISANWGVFYSKKLDLGFKVHVPSGTVAFRGREVIGNIISWSGLALRIGTDSPILQYEVEFGNKKYLLQDN